MSGATPLLTIPLRDGSAAELTPAGIRVGERQFELARVQDARRVVPNPETIALRVKGAGLVEFLPAREGDGDVFLGALFSLRPDLQPAGFEAPQRAFGDGAPLPAVAPSTLSAQSGDLPVSPPSVPLAGQSASVPIAYPPAPGYPPQYASAYGPPPGMYPPPPGAYAPPGMYPPPTGGYGYGQGPIPPYYGTTLDRSRGRLGPNPRGIADLLGAIVELFLASWKQWIVLGICVALIPSLLYGTYLSVVYVGFGINPLAASVLTGAGTARPAGALSPLGSRLANAPLSTLAALGGAGLAVVLVQLFFVVWRTGTLGIAARDAVLGRRVSIGRSLRLGLGRFWPVLGTVIVYSVLIALCLAPGVGLYFAGIVVWLTHLSTSSALVSPDPATSQALSLGGLLILGGLILLVVLGVLALFLVVRLGFATYIAATERSGVFASIGKSWRRTRGHWWRTFALLLILWVSLYLLTIPGGLVSVFSYPAGFAVAAPLTAVLTSVLTAITRVSILYDLRLRQEGFAGVLQASAEHPAEAPVQVGTDRSHTS